MIKKRFVFLLVFSIFFGFINSGFGNAFPRGFYKNPNKSEVLSGLNAVCRQAEKGAFNGRDIMPMVYCFARMLQIYPDLTKDYKDLARKVAKTGFSLVVLAMGKAGTLQARQALAELKKEFPERAKVIKQAESQKKVDITDFEQDPDVLWIEFFITGNKEIVHKVINLWLSDDIVAQRIARLYVYYRGHPDKRIVNLLKQLDIKVDKSGHIVSDEDIDLKLLDMLKGEDRDFRSRQKQEAARQLLLGLRIDDKSKEFKRIVAKSSAKWSLETNARYSKDVREICESYINRIDERKHKISMLRLLARVYADMPQDKDSRAKFLGLLQRLKSYTPDDGYLYYVTAQDCINRLDVPCLRNQMLVLQRVDKQMFSQLKTTGDWLIKALEYGGFEVNGSNAEIDIQKAIDANRFRKRYRADAILVNSSIPIGQFGALEAMASIQFLPDLEAEMQGKVFDGTGYLFISCRRKADDLFSVEGSRQAPIKKDSAQYKTAMEMLDNFSLQGLIRALSNAKLIASVKDNGKIVLKFQDRDGDYINIWVNPDTLYFERFIVHNSPSGSLRAVVSFWEQKGDNSK